MKKAHYIAVVVIIIIASGAFYGGMQYGTKKAKTTQAAGRENFNNEADGQHGGQGGPSGQRVGSRGNNAGGGGFINGDIISKDDVSITVKSQDGSSKIIFFSDSTTVGKATEGSISDLNAGERVMVSGKANSDGSIMAQNIQIRPVAENTENNPTQ